VRIATLAFALTACALGALAVAGDGKPDAEGFVSLFNGKDLAGWDGDPRFWSVKGGAIAGQTTKENPSRSNTFLVWKGGEVGDFELRLRARITGNNSGIQYRSRVSDPKAWKVVGYQCDFGGGPTHFAKLSDEGGLAPFCLTGEKVVISPDGKREVVESLGIDPGDLKKGLSEGVWYDLTVIARGDHLVHKVNGRVTIDCVNRGPRSSKNGILALQIHGGEPMIVEFKDIQLKQLR
jgi:hypothetical protein